MSVKLERNPFLAISRWSWVVYEKNALLQKVFFPKQSGLTQVKTCHLFFFVLLLHVGRFTCVSNLPAPTHTRLCTPPPILCEILPGNGVTYSDRRSALPWLFFPPPPPLCRGRACMPVSVIYKWLRNYRLRGEEEEWGKEGGGEGMRSCDIAAAACLRISVFSLGERAWTGRGEIGKLCSVLLC